jgi:bacterioferritin-associated ferredoxin
MTNPLSQYFRQPSIYIKLPSQGKNYPAGSLDMPVNGELPVYPMTAIDEITYRTPDALFNGQATVNVIQSCIPSIKNAWAIPSIDLDTILIAIRIASYGHDMDFGTTCPACNDTTERTIDLRTMLESLRSPNYEAPIHYGDLEIHFRPLSYKNLNDNSQLQFEQQKLLQVIPDSTVSDADKMTALTKAFKQLTEITVQSLSLSVTAIKTPQALVSEQAYIEDFLKNCDRELFNQIRDHVMKLRELSELQPLKLQCTACQHEYEQSLTLDMTSFFAPAS